MLRKRIIYFLLVILIVPFVYSLFSKSYDKSNLNGDFYPAQDVKFLYDLSYKLNGKIKRRQVIFDEQLKMIDDSEEFILIDLFLFNDEYDKDKMSFKNQVSLMTDKLIEKKKENPNIDIVFITDEINNFYGAYTEDNIKRLKENGIDVTITDPNMIRDSNPTYSGFYKFYLNWMGSPEGGSIQNIFAPKGPKVSVRSFLKLLNFKANHRKVMVTEKCGLVSSSNPHDPSSNHSNVAVKFYGKAMEDLIQSELALVNNTHPTIENFKVRDFEDKDIYLRAISEKAIYRALKDNVDKASAGDVINIGIFYIADKKLLKDLSSASNRGVKINIVADLNKDAFGLEKNGCPNRPALSELVDKNQNINVRWYKTHGEQYHSKFAYFNYKNEKPRIILGSANFTRRNLQNYNLETDVEVVFNKNSDIYKELDNYYKNIWNNVDGEYTLPFEQYYEDSIFLRTLWKIQESTGLCTW